jgi:FG-GAP-like repeat
MFSPPICRAAIIALLALTAGLTAVPAAAHAPDQPAAEVPAARPAGPAALPTGQPGAVPAAAGEEDEDDDGTVDPATPAEKIQAAAVVGLDTSQPSNPLGFNDRDFTFELWLLAKPDTEVRGTALLSLGDWDPQTETCVACTLYIRRGIEEAAQRDAADEIRDRQSAQAAESRRQRAAELVEMALTPLLVASSDRDFTIALWDFLAKQRPKFTATIAAAHEAFTTDATRVEAFLGGGLATAFDADQRRILEEVYAADAAALAEAKRKFARKYAANAVGVDVKVDDDAWMASSDTTFLIDLSRRLKGDKFWTLTYAALTDEVLNGTAASLARTISSGIFELVEKDRVRRNQEILKVYIDYVRRIRDDAVLGGRKNIARAGTAALTTNSIAKLWEFIEKRDALPKDSNELTLLHAVGTSVQIRTRSEIDRWTAASDRLLWKSPAGEWKLDTSRIVSGDFDADGKRDALLLNRGSTQFNAWFLTNVDGTVRAPVQVWSSGVDASTGRNYDIRNMAVGDFNGDGRSELIVLAKNKAGKTVILHIAMSAAGTWAHQETPVADAFFTGRFVGGDVNSDKKEDLIAVVQDATAGMQVWVALATATGLGTLVLKWSDKNFVMAATTNPVAIDTDNNGFAELALFRQEKGTKSDNGASLHIFSNLHGTPTRLEKWRAPGGLGATKLKVVAEDLNGDDYTDLILHYAWTEEGTMTYAMRNGPMGFQRVRAVKFHDVKNADLMVAES